MSDAQKRQQDALKPKDRLGFNVTDKSPLDIEWMAVDITDHVQRFKFDGGELFVEKSFYLAVKQELEHAQNIAWDRKCEVRKLQQELDSWKASASENHAKFCQARQELDAARAEIESRDTDIRSLCFRNKQWQAKLTDAKAQIAEYGAALELYASGEIYDDMEIRPEKKELWNIPEKWALRSMSDHWPGKKARECLNKWREK